MGRSDAGRHCATPRELEALLTAVLALPAAASLFAGIVCRAAG